MSKGICFLIAASPATCKAVNDFLNSFRKFGMSAQAEVALVFDSDNDKDKFFTDLNSLSKVRGSKDIKFDIQANAEDDDLFFFLSDDKPVEKKIDKPVEQKKSPLETKSNDPPVKFEEPFYDKPVEKKSAPTPQPVTKPVTKDDDAFFLFDAKDQKSEKTIESKPSKPVDKTEPVKPVENKDDDFFLFEPDEPKTKPQPVTKPEPIKPVESLKTVEKKIESKPVENKDDDFFMFEGDKVADAESVKLADVELQQKMQNKDSFFFFPALDQKSTPMKKSLVASLIDGGDVKIRSFVLPEEFQNKANNCGTDRARCLYAMDKLRKDYDYIVTCGTSAVITKNVNLHALFDEFFKQKTLWGNITTTTNPNVEWIKMSCTKWFASTVDWQNVLSLLYLWSNQPQIYKTDTLDEFFEVTDILNNLTAIAWTDFPYYVYMYYLILYQGFKIKDIGLKAVVGLCESNSIQNLKNKVPEFKPMVCKKTISKDLDNDNLFMVFS